ncbi:hypothetical protein DUNSADRAFT_7480 [Dunaliella salina]|uniref:Uncharacterized protein n=1 Tax=Dunaliella salina TaxID=3046 RepID=A0ABQ7GLA2_DUNSA|nr:hypothetical protein DUNSADRAFT_7480 [Dunaliella salina]|eukprot:KAF5835395.1 hypothetical protein DUNSADRAFT_7480 [Dunaliella salina]
MEPREREWSLPNVEPVSMQGAAKLHVANMMRLCKDLRLPVAFKVHEECMEPQAAGDSAGKLAQLHERKFVVIVHVQSDFAFKKYLDNCSNSDLMLYRGLLLEVSTTPNVSSVLSASVRQAFLPKFETEDKDASIANCIVDQASERAMVVTIKHSGSLVTLSGNGFAAKNSVGNAFTEGAQTLLQAHFDRVFGSGQGPAKLASLMALLRARRMAVSFEMVTGSHGHHGQLPAAEYLVTTAAHTLDTDTAKPIFLTWLDFLRFCVEQHLPVNDTWLLAGCEWAAAARDVLDYQALNGGLTASAVVQLNKLVQLKKVVQAIFVLVYGAASAGQVMTIVVQGLPRETCCFGNLFFMRSPWACIDFCFLSF